MYVSGKEIPHCIDGTSDNKNQVSLFYKFNVVCVTVCVAKLIFLVIHSSKVCYVVYATLKFRFKFKLQIQKRSEAKLIFVKVRNARVYNCIYCALLVPGECMHK